MSAETLFFGEADGTGSWFTLLDAEGESVFKAPPDGNSSWGDGEDWKK